MIEVRNLSKKYGDHLAVDNISFTVEAGHIYGFLGPNGAGKSTTMNMITGYIAATEGEIVIDGHDILKDARAAKACIGYLPEQPPLYQDLTVREYLEFAADIKGIKKADKKDAVDKTIQTAMLGEVEKRLIRNLSKGFRQRVGFAQAVIGLPEVLILDEPTSGLDPKQIIEIRDLIKELGRDHTVILSSHILSEVEAVCDRVIMISGGTIVADASLEELTAEKKLEEVFLELTDADRMDSMDIIDIAREQDLEEPEGPVGAAVTEEVRQAAGSEGPADTVETGEMAETEKAGETDDTDDIEESDDEREGDQDGSHI